MRISAPRIIFLFLGISLLSFLPSCSVLDPKEDIPAYLKIDSVGLNTTYSLHGTNSHKITDAWVYVNDELIGAFELPATIPVLKEGAAEIKVLAGIKVSGVSALRDKYPFYNFYTSNVNLVPGEVQTVNPVVSYFSGYVPFELIEGFESAGISFTDTMNSDTTFQLVSGPGPNVFEGNKSAGIFLDSNHPYFLALSASSYQMPTNGTDVYLELNYKCNQKFSIGVLGGFADYRESILLNPTDGWNKIYILLTPQTSAFPSYTSYKLYIAMQRDPSVPNPEVFLDNIKLIW